jgi:hypothetical protein
MITRSCTEAANHHSAGAEAANHTSLSTTMFPCPMGGPMAHSSCQAAYVSLRYLSQLDGGILVLPHVICKTQINTDLNSQNFSIICIITIISIISIITKIRIIKTIPIIIVHYHNTHNQHNECNQHKHPVSMSLVFEWHIPGNGANQINYVLVQDIFFLDKFICGIATGMHNKSDSGTAQKASKQITPA